MNEPPIRRAILGRAVRCAAGDLHQTLHAMQANQAHFAAQPPYDSTGLSVARCATVERDASELPATDLLTEVVRQALSDSVLPQDARVALVVGTSSGGLAGAWERWFASDGTGRPPLAARRDGPTQQVAAELALSPALTVSVACTSGTLAFAVAEHLLDEDAADAVVVAGVDVLCPFVHSGFASLGALASDLPRPFCADRDGLLLGEGAAAVVLGPAREDHDLWLHRTAAASDARHFTAPDREASGARAVLEALADAPVQLVSLHGTGTRFNDAAEATALLAHFPAHDVNLHGLKGLIGHTMGAAGAIEAAVLAECLAQGLSPRLPVDGAPSDDDPAPALADFATDAAPQRGLSLSAAFGGANAGLVLDTRPPTSHKRHRVRTGDLLDVALDGPWASRWPDEPPRTRRLDDDVRSGVFALEQWQRVHGLLPTDAALVLTTTRGCARADRQHMERLLAEGASRVSRRAFTYTVVHAPLAEASLRWGLRGPQLALVDDDPATGWLQARALVARGAPVAVALFLDLPEEGGPQTASVRGFWRDDP